MTAVLFSDILEKGMQAGHIPARNEEAKRWFRQTAGRVRRVNEGKLFAEAQKVNRVQIGMMYMFQYDPKHKATLPYYDRLPLIFPFAKTEDGFLGINFHYIPPRYRAKLMDALYANLNNPRFNEQTKIRLNYQLLKSTANMRYFKPCVKRYLSSHVRSQFIFVHPNEWDIALYLPTARFEKKSISHVHQQSRKMF